MSITNIKLFEHNSSRLLFVNNQDPNFKLDIVELDQDPSENDKCNCDNPKFLLGKLNNYIWLLEDSGDYDTNHTHQANINHMDQYNNTETLFNVDRIMEWNQDSDRIYTAHGGGLKYILLDSPVEDQIVEFFIKSEKSLPCFEKIMDLRDTETGNVFPGCLVFYRYDTNNILQKYQIVQLIGGLNVLDNNTLQPMNNINYCSINIKNIMVNFNQLKFTYSIEPNNTNDIKINYIGTQSLYTDSESGNYGKFISGDYYLNNDNYIEPGIFLIQVPKNRSWICYRSFYSSSFSFGSAVTLIPRSNISTLSFERENKYKNNCKCFYLDCCGLNGYYGILENNKYVYEINIDRNDKEIFFIMIPNMFSDYESLQYLDNNGNIVSSYMDLGANEFREENIYNELDGMFYKAITIPVFRNYCKIYKVKLTYNKV